MPSISCSNCGKIYRVADELAGKRLKCRQCGNVLVVPVPAASADAAPPTASAKKSIGIPPPIRRTAPAAPVASEVDLSTAPAAPVASDVDLSAMAELESTGRIDNSIPLAQPSYATAAPPNRRTTIASKAVKSVKPRFGFRLDGGVIACLVLGVVLLAYGLREWSLARSASVTPQSITCAELSANGPGSNANVQVTDFLSMANFIYQKGPNGDWATVWLPIVPPSAVHLKKNQRLTGSKKIMPKAAVDSSLIHVLIKSHTVATQADVSPAMNRDSVEGMVINKIESLTANERRLLQNAYPLMDVDNCWVVEDGRKPAGQLGFGISCGGAGLILVGLFLMFRPE